MDKAMKKQMNGFLADLVIEAHKIQAFHWYVKGPDFFDAHEQLEKYYELVAGLVDEVAEAMLMCGMKPASTCKDFLAKTSIAEAGGAFATSKEAYAEITRDFKHLLESAKNLKRAGEKAELDLVVIKAENYIEEFSKAVWMLDQR